MPTVFPVLLLPGRHGARDGGGGGDRQVLLTPALEEIKLGTNYSGVVCKGSLPRQEQSDRVTGEEEPTVLHRVQGCRVMAGQ